MSEAQPISIGTIDHVVLRVTDLDRMRAFYCDILGCRVEKHQAGLGLLQLRAGASLIDLVDVAGRLGRMGGRAAGIEGRNMDHFCLRLDRFDGPAIQRYLSDRGIDPGEIVQRYGAAGTGPSLYIEDPEGNTVELKAPPDTAG